MDSDGQEDQENQDYGDNAADGSLSDPPSRSDVPVFHKGSWRTRKKEKDVKNQIKRFLYRELQRYTGETPDWGILTGVRPVKLAGELLEREGDGRESKRGPDRRLLSH